MKRSIILLLISLLCLVSCSEQKPELTASEILQRSIDSYGGPQFFNSTITFKVDDLDYKLIRQDHLTDFTVSREKDGYELVGRYRNGFQEYIVDGKVQEEGNYSRRILNSKLDGFVYTQSFPHVLQQNGIDLQRLADVTIRKQRFLTIQAITKPLEDVEQDEVILYVHPETYEIHYVAEQLQVNGGYLVFRRCVNFRSVNGILFSDYYSFASSSDTITLKGMYKGYELAYLREMNKTEIKDSNVVYP